MKNKSLISIILALLIVAVFPSCRNQTSYEKDSSKLSKAHKITSIDPDELPDTTSSPVLDMVGVLSDDDLEIITSQIEELDSIEWAQIAVVIVDDLHGHNRLTYANAILRKWGVGHKDKNDGIVILVKPKTADSKGEAAIATGLGMQDILSDHTCRRIVDEKMIPAFKDDEYGYGITHAIGLIAKILSNKAT